MAADLDRMLWLSGTIAIGFLIAVAFYESLSTRDVLVGRVMRWTRRITRRRLVAAIAYLLTVGVGIPLLVVIWTVVLEIVLIAVGSIDQLGNLAVVAAAIVGAARILSYAREKTAHELAKAIPLALAFVLLTGGALNLEPNLTRLIEEPERARLAPELLAFLIALELGLRVISDSARTAVGEVRRRRGLPVDTGVWRTLWAVLRHPIARALPDRDPEVAPLHGRELPAAVLLPRRPGPDDPVADDRPPG